tara:strand:+ start:412 stop:2559 length:2148 start_codon:yes stop_codon:yes gene_type:complete
MAVQTPYVEYIKISRTDESGQDLTPTLEALTQIKLPFTNGVSVIYYPISRTRYGDYFLFSLSKNGNAAPLAADAGTIDYNFTSSISTTPVQHQFGFPDFYSEIIPLNTPTTDPLNFFNDVARAYQFNTLPQKDIVLDIESQVNISVLLFGQNVRISVFIIDPITFSNSTVLSATGRIATEVYLVTQNGIQNFNKTVTIPKENITPGNQIVVIFSGGGGFAGLAGATFQPNSKFSISSTAESGITIPTIPEPYLPSRFAGTDCDVLLNNVDQYPPNRFLQDIDYSGNPNTPVNFNALLSGSAAKGTVPESYYTSKNQIDPRYNGVKNQSSDVNLYNPKAGNTDFGVPTNIGTFGQTPPITSLDNTIVEFQWAGGTTPEIPLGGSFKLLNKILEVTSTNQVRTITPGDNPYEFGYIRKINSASSSPNFFLPISESRGDYYQALNNSYKRGTKLVPFIYVPNPGSSPTLPSITTIIETTIQVPSVSKFAGSSSYSTEGGYNSYGRWSSGNNYITIFGGNNNTPGFPGLERFITKLSYNDDEGRYGTRKSISVSGSGQSEVMDPILRSLESGERWFITLLNNFDYPISVNDKSQIFSEIIGSGNPGNNQQELNKKGVFEITGMSRSTGGGSFAGALNFYTNVSNFTGTDYYLGNDISGNPSLGFLIWKSPDSNQSAAVIVEDVTTGGVGTGAFISEFTTDTIKENFEEITRKYGSNTSG